MEDQASQKSKSCIPNGLVLLVLAVVIGGVYFSTMLWGVSDGDAAEVQVYSVLLGVGHSPGYAIQMSAGKLFSMLPFGPGPAWRINFMVLLLGTLGALALYDAVRLVTGSVAAGAVAALVLTFSAMYWKHSLFAEVYVFYDSFLLFALWAFVHWTKEGNSGWLIVTAFFAGVCAANRISEALVLPGFLLAWLSVRKEAKLKLVPVLICIVVFLVPFLYSIVYFVVRHNHESFYRRDLLTRTSIQYNDFDLEPWSPGQTWKKAFSYTLGLSYVDEAGFSKENARAMLDAYFWHLSGNGAAGDRYPEGDGRNRMQDKGTSIGFLGLLLAAAGVVMCRRKWGWAALGLWFFAANLAFVVWHFRWDGLTFTIPSLIGLSFLAGLGASGNAFGKIKPLQRTWQAAAFAAPIFLLVSNYGFVDMSTPKYREIAERNLAISQAPFPSNAVVLDTYWPAMTYRYLFYVQAPRQDIQVIHHGTEHWKNIIEHFTSTDTPVYLNEKYLPPRTRQQLAQLTTPGVANVGFLLINPKVGQQPSGP